MVSVLLAVVLIEWKRMLGTAQPGVLVSHSPGQEGSADAWIVDEACGQEVFVDLGLLGQVPVAAVVHLHIEFSDVDLEAEAAKLLDLFSDVFALVGSSVGANVGLDADTIDLDLLQLHVLDHLDHFVCLEVV